MSPGLFLTALVAAVSLFVAPWLVFQQAPLESTMGFIQKIFYFHVPSAWMLLLSAFVCAGGSIAYLWKRSATGDALAAAAAELAVIFGLIMVVTGPLWARKAWGKWWVWDVRLTSALLLWMIFVAYQFARKHGGPAARTLAAGVACFGAADVPLVYASVAIWRTIHPKSEVVRTLDPGMRPAFWMSALAITALWTLLLMVATAQWKTRDSVEEAFAEVTS